MIEHLKVRNPPGFEVGVGTGRFRARFSLIPRPGKPPDRFLQLLDDQASAASPYDWFCVTLYVFNTAGVHLGDKTSVSPCFLANDPCLTP